MGREATRGHKEKVFIRGKVLEGENENNSKSCRAAKTGAQMMESTWSCMNPSCALQQDARNTQELMFGGGGGAKAK